VLPDIERNVRGMADWVILPPAQAVDGIWDLTRSRLDTLRSLRPA
jgi:hypothetical protein